MTETKKKQHCPECGKEIAWLKRNEKDYECSRAECGNRKPVTARPPAGYYLNGSHINDDQIRED